MNRSPARSPASVTGLYARIYEVVRLIPPGQVATYGQIAALVGCRPRQVGYAMAALPAGSDVPWARVLNSRGEVSLPGAGGDEQRALLAAEGVVFDARGRTSLKRFGWGGPDVEAPVDDADLWTP